MGMLPSKEFVLRQIKYFKSHNAGNCLPIWDGPYKSLTDNLNQENVDAIIKKLESLYIDDLWGLDYNQINSWQIEPYDTCFNECLKVICSELTLDANRPNEIVVGDIERIVGFPLNMTVYPHRPTINVGVRQIPLRAVVCYYIIHCILKHKTTKLTNVLEIGAGTGYFPYFFNQYLTSKYHIIDLPIISVIQTFIYATMVGEDKVWFHGEPESKTTNLFIYSPDSIGDLNQPMDLVLNQNSFPEMPTTVQSTYLNKIRELLTDDAFFYSVNWEPDNSNQTPTAIACSSNNFVCKHRRLFPLESKVHVGNTPFFEEIYRPKV